MYIYLSLKTRKPVTGVCDQVRLTLAFSSTETSLSLEILDVARKDYADAQADLHLFLFAYGLSRFAHYTAHL